MEGYFFCKKTNLQEENNLGKGGGGRAVSLPLLVK